MKIKDTNPSISRPALVLAGIPESLRQPLLSVFNSIIRNYRERRWEPAELNGGKLCEVIYSILIGHTTGKFPHKPKKPKNMVDACKALENADSNKFSRSVRIQIPRMIVALYEIRNNRGVGHVGGDVEPNHMDALQVLEMSKWLIAELVRIFHGIKAEEAQAVIEGLIDRTYYTVWEVGGKKRDLNSEHSKKESTLTLLYSGNKPLSLADLFRWTEHSNMSSYKKDVLKPLHKNRFIEFDESSGLIQISPLGMRYVEEKRLLII